MTHCDPAVLDAIAYVETRSEVHDGNVKWIGHNLKGKAGELGVYQITYVAFKEVAKKGEHFHTLLHDHSFSRSIADRYLFELYCRYGSWQTAIVKYNGSKHYLTLVEQRLASRQR